MIYDDGQGLIYPILKRRKDGIRYLFFRSNTGEYMISSDMDGLIVKFDEEPTQAFYDELKKLGFTEVIK